jgi:hypothetical protein
VSTHISNDPPIVIDTTDHPVYTADAALACGAARWGGDHQCSCVYRRRHCDGNYHLCMCGGDWSSPGSCECTTPREKESNTMATPVSVTINVTQGEFALEVSMHADVVIGSGTVAATQLERAAKAMAVLLNQSGPQSRDEDYDDPRDDDRRE